jgi:hypothetical protein
MSDSANPVEEEVIDMVEEPGSDTWTTSSGPSQTNDIGQKVPLFGNLGGSAGKNRLPLIIGLVVLGILLCCVLNSCSGCANLLGNTASTATNNAGVLGGLLGGDTGTTQVPKTRYQARMENEVTLGGVTILLESGVQFDEYFGRDVDAYRATIWNNSNQTVTFKNDGGWSALDASGNYLEYNWESEQIGNSNTDTGQIAPGSTYVITFVFTDSAGNPARPSAIVADFSPALDGYTSIEWGN